MGVGCVWVDGWGAWVWDVWVEGGMHVWDVWVGYMGGMHGCGCMGVGCVG